MVGLLILCVGLLATSVARPQRAAKVPDLVLQRLDALAESLQFMEESLGRNQVKSRSGEPMNGRSTQLICVPTSAKAIPAAFGSSFSCVCLLKNF